MMYISVQDLIWGQVFFIIFYQDSFDYMYEHTIVTCLFGRFIIDHHGDRQGIEEEVILHAVQTTLVGNAFIFCLKTATPPEQSAAGSATVHKLPMRAQPLCLADLLPSQKNGGKQSDLVAVQMIRANAKECSTYLTVLDVLKSLVEGEMNQPSFASGMSLQRAFSPNEEAHRSQTQLSISHRNSPNRRWTGKSSSICLDMSHETNKRRGTCADCGRHHSNTCVTSESSSTDHTLSTDSTTSQISLMFSCQSSMDQEFPSELSLTGASGRPGVRCSGGNSTLTNPRESKGNFLNESDYSFRVESLLSPGRGTRESLREKLIPFAGGRLDDKVTICETRNPQIVNSQNVCIAGPAKESVISCDDFFEDEKENCVHLDSTLPDLGQSLTSINCSVLSEQPNSLQSCLRLSDIGSSFSSSLNDSSLLLGDVDANYCSLKTTQEKESQKEIEEEVRTARPHTGNVAQVFSRQCQIVIPGMAGEKTVVSKRKSRYVDMPHSENLSLFLEGMVSQDGEHLSENSKGSAQHHVSEKCFHESEFVPGTRQQKRQQSNEKGRLGSHKRCRLDDSVESCDCHFGESRSRPASLSSAPRYTNSTDTISLLVSTEADVTDCSERKADAELPRQDAFDDGTVLHGCGDEVHSKQITWQPDKHSFAAMSKKHASKIHSIRTTCLSDKHACVPERGTSSTAAMSQLGMEADTKCPSNLLSESLCRQQAQDEQHLLVEQTENTVLVMPDSEDLDNFLDNLEWDTHTCHASQGTAMENRASYKTYHSYHDKTARKPLAQRQNHLNSKLVCTEEERLLTSDVKVASQQIKSSPPLKPGGRKATRQDVELGSKGTVVLSSDTHKAVHRTAAEVHNTAWNKAHQVCCPEAGKRQSWEMSQRVADMCTENGREAVCCNSFVDGSLDLFLSQGTNATDHGNCGHSVCSFVDADPPSTTLSENNVSHVGQSELSTEEFTGDSLSSRSCAILEHSSDRISSRVTSVVVNDNKPANDCEPNKNLNYNCMCCLPEDPQRKKVRFSRRRRVSSVQAMDMRMEKYTMQRNSSNLCLAETPTNTFDRSSVGQSVRPVNTNPMSSSGTPTINRSCLRLPFSPVPAFVSNLTNHHLASMCKCSTPLSRRESTVQNSIQSDELTQSGLTPIVASARHSVYLLGSQEHIGSQDLFSSLSRDENNLPAQNRLPGTGDLPESYLRFERMQTDVELTPCLKSAFGDCESPSSFDCSDTLFDNSESLPQSQHDQASCILLLPHSSVQTTVASTTVGWSDNESKNPVIAGSKQTPHPVTHFVSASATLSPDLFSP